MKTFPVKVGLSSAEMSYIAEVLVTSACCEFYCRYSPLYVSSECTCASMPTAAALELEVLVMKIPTPTTTLRVCSLLRCFLMYTFISAVSAAVDGFAQQNSTHMSLYQLSGLGYRMIGLKVRIAIGCKDCLHSATP